MRKDQSKQSGTTDISDSKQAARTDDLLASGTERHDGADGFGGRADGQALQTGMEGISRGNSQQAPGEQSNSQQLNATNKTVPDKPGQMRNKGGN